MNYYTVFHHHRHGHDIYLALSKHTPTLDEVIQAFEIDFEDDRDDEWIAIDKVYPQTIGS